MARTSAPEADRILDRFYPILDKGGVALIDYMGNDERVEEAARVSYQQGTTKKRSTGGLIDYLVRNDHASPVEMVELLFFIKAPLFVVQQILRHRTANVNQESARYSVLKDEFYIPSRNTLKKQDTKNRQGSANEPLTREEQERALEIIRQTVAHGYESYTELLDMGLAREKSRIVLPVTTYTSLYWKCDLRNFLNFARLRMDWHAQPEIQRYAAMLYELSALVAPLTVAAYEKYVLNTKRVSVDFLEEIHAFLQTEQPNEDRAQELQKTLEKLLF